MDFFITGNEIIICAGALKFSQVPTLSKIRPSNSLWAVNSSVAFHLPLVGARMLEGNFDSLALSAAKTFLMSDGIQKFGQVVKANSRCHLLLVKLRQNV